MAPKNLTVALSAKWRFESWNGAHYGALTARMAHFHKFWHFLLNKIQNVALLNSKLLATLATANQNKNAKQMLFWKKRKLKLRGNDGFN